VSSKSAKKARILCEKALQAYFEDSRTYIVERRDFISSVDAHKKLSVNEINDGVCLFVLFTQMGGGSIGTVNLYSLLQAYLLEPDMRRQINEVLGNSHDIEAYPK